MPLPPGLTINASTGAIVGRPTEAACVNGEPTDYTFTVEARTSTGLAARRRDTIRVYPYPEYTVTAPAGTVGVAYTGALTLTNSPSTPVVYAVASGALPTGLALNAGTGAITGTPTVAGTYTGAFRVTGDKAGFDPDDTAFSIVIS
jgi:hypothetical protein